MAEIETHRGVVYPWQCDHMGHMNVTYYMAAFDAATWHLFAHLGITPDYMRSNERGMAAVEQTLHYLREVLPGDVVVVRSRPIEMKDKSLRFGHRMVDGVTGVEVATTELVAVHLDRRQRAACPFPQEIRAAVDGWSSAG